MYVVNFRRCEGFYCFTDRVKIIPKTAFIYEVDRNNGVPGVVYVYPQTPSSFSVSVEDSL